MKTISSCDLPDLDLDNALKVLDCLQNCKTIKNAEIQLKLNKIEKIVLD